MRDPRTQSRFESFYDWFFSVQILEFKMLEDVVMPQVAAWWQPNTRGED